MTKQDTVMSKSNVITLLMGLLLGWFALPLVVGATGAMLFFVVVAIVILVLRLLDRANAIWVIIGLVVGILIGLLLPQLSSSAFGDEGLVRAFLCLWLVCTV